MCITNQCIDSLQDKHKRKSSAVILPVRMGNGGVALESSFSGGVKQEVLRSLCQLVNTTELALEVASLMLSIKCMYWCAKFAGLELSELSH